MKKTVKLPPVRWISFPAGAKVLSGKRIQADSDGEEAEFRRLLALCEEGTESDGRCVPEYVIDGDTLHITVKNSRDSAEVYTLDVKNYRQKGGTPDEPQ